MEKEFYVEFYKYFTKWLTMDYLTPGYMAEVTIDTLLSGYVAEIVGTRLGVEDMVLISKEFPIRRLKNIAPKGDMPVYTVANNQNDRNNYLNAKVDYLLASKNQNKLYFVELKTTGSSYVDKQLKQMIYSAATVKESLKFYNLASNTTKSKNIYSAYEKLMGYKVNDITGKLVEGRKIDIKSQTPSIECVYLTMETMVLHDTEFKVGKDTYRGYIAPAEDNGIPIWGVNFMEYEPEEPKPGWEAMKAIFDEIVAATKK